MKGSLTYSMIIIMKKIWRVAKVISFLQLTIALVACNSTQNDICHLVPTQDSLVFELNPQTSMFIKYLSLYTDEKGVEYLTFQNNIEPEILWYDMNTQKHVRTIKLDREGGNGVGMFCGYNINSEDEIYIPETMRPMIDVVNSKGDIIRKIEYNKASLGKSVIPFMCSCFPYRSIYFLDSKMYIPQTLNPRLPDAMKDSPVTLILDTINNTLVESEIRFPQIMSTDELKGNTLGVESYYSYCYNGKDLVYSFFFDEDIYVVSLDGSIQRMVKVKSKYLDEIYNGKKTPSDIAKTLCSIPMYGNLIYDKYREVYYRFVYPETELAEGNYVDIWQLGRSNFSIIVLDKDFKILGETLLPENTYASSLFFIREDGLYISTSFVKNPNYNDDQLCFRRFDLIR